MNPLRLVTLAGDPEREPEVAAQLADHSNVDLLLRCMDRMELLATMRGGGINAIVSVGAPSWFDAASAEETARAGLRIVGVVEVGAEADRLAALGASLIPAGSSAAEIVSRCRSVEAPPPPPRPSSQPSKPNGRLIAVWGPKGAPGRSSIAIELAYEIAAAGDTCLLIDENPTAETSSRCSDSWKRCQQWCGQPRPRRMSWMLHDWTWTFVDRAKVVRLCCPGSHEAPCGPMFLTTVGVSC